MENFGFEKKFGFGFMRLPLKDGAVDREVTCKMVDIFMENGFCYFDTAHGYMDGLCEGALRDALTSRYPRESYLLTNKLSSHFISKAEDVRPLFQSQLEACGVDYFDFYLMHAQNAASYEEYKKLRAYETSLELREEGKIKHFGISFHDKAEVLERILNDYPQIEVVQLQFNYIDYDDPSVESRKCYEVCEKHHKPVIVMEPVKGGTLAKLPEDAMKIIEELNGGSPASYAIRFAASFPNIIMVLSGMGTVEMVEENCSFMKDFVPLDEKEREAIDKVRDVFAKMDLIPCTDCRYCTEQCPQGIAIPALFACLNAKKTFKNWNADFYYNNVHTSEGHKASDCIKCGVCEAACPQHLKIRDLLVEVVNEFGA